MYLFLETSLDLSVDSTHLNFPFIVALYYDLLGAKYLLSSKTTFGPKHSFNMQYPILLLILTLSLSATVADEPKRGCQPSCGGNVTVPYPFGIGDECFLEGFEITCNDSFTPPRPFLHGFEVLNISLAENQVTVKNFVAHTGWGYDETFATNNMADANFTDTPFVFSKTANRFTVTGCNSFGMFQEGDGEAIKGCLSVCNTMNKSDDDQERSNDKSCSGVGCCQTTISGGLKSLSTLIGNLLNGSDIETAFNESGIGNSPRYQCGYAFLADVRSYVFESSDLDQCFSPKIENSGLVLDWVVANRTCEEARKLGSYACKENSECWQYDSGGYRCNCSEGYHGNPYLSHGCQDIDECKPPNNPCEGDETCINLEGSFYCKCPGGTRRVGQNCSNSFPVIEVVLGFTSLLVLLFSIPAVYFFLKRRKLIKLREKFFRENGGLLLQQQNPSRQNAIETTKTFTAKELEIATDHYSSNRIIGEGGNGTVYQGVLNDNRIVAVKKSKVVDKTQIEQFINEVVILTQINHRNVVKLLGCCLETEVPLLVYEFVPNGSLFYHIHSPASSVSWEIRLRIAIETASALYYLHSAASISIIHRDVKSANILLDDRYIAKVSDFGASRLVPIDQTQISTLVQGTLGYLDPEYFQTSQLTEKSDVYSYGVVLIELLTGAMPMSFARPEPQRNLSSHFILSMRENRLFEILEPGLGNQQNEEEIEAVADLAMRCLRLKGDERPTMKEVVIELTGLRKSEKHPWNHLEVDPDEALRLLEEQ